jgi:hypothetical protein
MDRELAIAVVPPLIWSVLLLVVLLIFRDAIRERLKRVKGLSLLGFAVQLEADEVKTAVLHRESGLSKERLDTVASSVVARADWLQPVLRGALVVWLDEEPENNQMERGILRRMGVFTEVILHLDDAVEFIESNGDEIDAVISENLTRDDVNVGELLLERLGPNSPPTVLYVTHLKPGLPDGAVGVTNRPGVLFHLVMDAIERSPRAAARAAEAVRTSESGCSVSITQSAEDPGPTSRVVAQCAD